MRMSSLSSVNTAHPVFSKPLLQLIFAMSDRIIFKRAVHRIASFFKEADIPVAGVDHHNASAVFLHFPLEFRKETGADALIAVRLIHPQHFEKRDIPEVHARKAGGCRPLSK